MTEVGAVALLRINRAAAKPPITPTISAAAAPINHFRERTGVIAATLEVLLLSIDDSSANAKSRADSNRSCGRFSRHRLKARTTAGGRLTATIAGSGGSSRRIADIVSAAVSRLYAR